MAFCLTAGCALLEDHTNTDPMRQPVRLTNTPVVPADNTPAPAPAPTPAPNPPTAPAANPAPATPTASTAPKATTTISPSIAHLTAGKRTDVGNEPLAIDNPPISKTDATMPVQRLTTGASTRWTGDHLSWEQARDLLRARGVTWMQLDLRDGVWRLQCSIPNPQDPQKVRVFEAQASDDIGAVRAVLEKIDGGNK